MPHPVRHPAIAAVGPADQPLLAALGRYFYLTAAQLTRLLYAPTSHKYAQARIKRLADAGYVQRLFLPRPTRTGSAPLVYTLARKGLNLLVEWGIDVDRRYRPAEVRELSYLYLAHTLALNDVLIALELLARSTPMLEIAELRHERELKLHPVTVTLADGSRAGVIPDAWVDLRLTGERQRYQECYAIELDRGTTEQKAWRRKVAALVAFAAGPYQQPFGSSSLTIAVVATPGPTRSEQLLRWTEAELRQLGREDAGTVFRFTGVPIASARPEDLFRGAAWRAPFAERLEPLLDLTEVEVVRAR